MNVDGVRCQATKEEVCLHEAENRAFSTTDRLFGGSIAPQTHVSAILLLPDTPESAILVTCVKPVEIRDCD
jgi:hypothetical protein